MGVGGYFVSRGTDVAGLFLGSALFYGRIALAVIWLAVLVVVGGREGDSRID